MAKPYGRIYQNKTNVSVDANDLYNVWPVGSVYMSIFNVNPSNYFGGTWERIKGYYLFCNDQETLGGEIFGSWFTNNTAITPDQMPAHSHNISANASFTIANGEGSGLSGIPSGVSGWGNPQYPNAHWYRIWAEPSGANQGHNHEFYPPSIRVFAWRRIS